MCLQCPHIWIFTHVLAKFPFWSLAFLTPHNLHTAWQQMSQTNLAISDAGKTSILRRKLSSKKLSLNDSQAFLLTFWSTQLTSGYHRIGLSRLLVPQAGFHAHDWSCKSSRNWKVISAHYLPSNQRMLSKTRLFRVWYVQMTFQFENHYNLD